MRLRILLLTTFLLAVVGCTEPEPKERPWNVLLITMDTTRADFLGPYGRTDATTPTLDGLAAEGFVFERAHTSNPITQPAHSTILTGVYPLMHGVRDNGLFRLPEELDTLAERLKAHGFATGAAIGGFPLTRQFGTDQGFDFYDDDLRANRQDHRGRPAERQYETWYDERPAPHVNDAILGWLRKRPDQPFFVWLHYWDPHEPHIAPPPWGQIYAHDPYQGEIAFTDDSFGNLLAQLDQMGELDRTLIVVTSDHGEGRREHNELTHAFLAYETTLHVPLIIRPPGVKAPGRIAQNVGTVDIVPTVLDFLGFEITDDLQGRTLVPLTEGAEDYGADERYYAESISPRMSHGFGELRVLYEAKNKYIYGPRPELFNTFEDPNELNDLIATHTDRADEMKRGLQGMLDFYAGDLSASHEFDDETMRRLAGLGYLNTSGDDVTVTEELRDDGAVPQDHVNDINRTFQLRRLIGSGAFRMAAEIAEEILRDAPDDGYVQAQLAVAYVGTGDIDKALELVRASMPPTASNLGAFASVANAWFESGAQVDALALMNELLTGEQSASALVALASMYQARDEHALRIDALKRAVETDGDDRNARLMLAFALLENEQSTAAEPHIHELIKRLPADGRAHFALSQVYWQQSDPDAALERIGRALLFNPDDCDANLMQIDWLGEAGRDEEAAQAQAAMPRHCRDQQAALTANSES